MEIGYISFCYDINISYMLDYPMSTGGLYPAPAPVERIPSGYLNPVGTDPVVNGNSYVCLVPFFNRLVQNSGLIQGTSGVLPGNGFIQNSSLTGSYTPIIMESPQTPALVRHNFRNYISVTVQNFALVQ